MAELFEFKISTYSLDVQAGDLELFLSFTPAKRLGPPIERDGLGPPRMIDARKPWSFNEERSAKQRIQTWRVGDPLKANRVVLTLLSSYARRIRDWSEDAPLTTHCDHFRHMSNGEWEIEAVQGCGNLSMNLWFVAYVRPSSHFAGSRRPGGQDEPGELIFVPDEARLLSAPSASQESDRTYSCLVKWSQSNTAQLSISSVRFNPFDSRQSVSAFDRQDHLQNVTDGIEFAVFGQQVIRDGNAVDLGTVAHQFADVRHLFRLPNLRDVLPEAGHDVWFGENQLIGPADWDRRRGAMSRPVELDWSYVRNLGFSKRSMDEWIKLVSKAFVRKGYAHIHGDTRPPQRPGEFRFDLSNRTLVDVWLLPNPYPWTFIGLGKPSDEEDPFGRTNRLIMMAVSGSSGRCGLNLREAIDKLRSQAGAYSAILVDQGYDVFQFASGVFHVKSYGEPLAGGECKDMRDRLRAVFILARRKAPALPPFAPEAPALAEEQ